MTGTADALEVMAVVTACHHRTAPRMDDEQATLATATVWAELFDPYNFDTAELVAAVKKRAENCAEAPEPADIIHVARQTRNEAIERMNPNESVIPADAPHRATAIAELVRNRNPDDSDDVPFVNVLMVKCGFCGSAAGEHCTMPGMPGKPREQLRNIPGHPSRIEAAAIAAGHSPQEAAMIATALQRQQTSRALRPNQVTSGNGVPTQSERR